ncbi:MAG: valine--pyruvate transaminase [Candidatus Roizmanbacteria bacterium]
MQLTKFGQKYTQMSGIHQLMDDLGKAMSGQQNMKMLGGGNPAHIPEIDLLWREQMNIILNTSNEFESMIGNYTTPQGDITFIQAMVDFINCQYQWGITNKNISILNGSQTSFYFLFNLIAGTMSNGSKKKILLPIVPEYIGYADQCIEEDSLVGVKPLIEHIDKHTYKYKINFESLNVIDDIGAICISRPTNPTGNVITEEEVTRLAEIAEKNHIPFILDNAYGLPFPSIIFTEAKPIWTHNMIYVMSLSKLGLPSTRTSIVIANEEISHALSSINAIVSLSTGTLGQHLVTPILQSGRITDIAQNIIRPYYQKKSEHAIKILKDVIRDDIPYHIHKSEGALFIWLWCEHLSISSQELYQSLKQKGVLIVPGHYFFPGFDEEWQHKNECIRISYAMDEKIVEEGLIIIGNEINNLY